MASIDQRGRLWRARVRLPGHTPKSRSFKTRTEAEQWARCTEILLSNGVDSVADLAAEPTLEEALGRYLRDETPLKKGAEQETRRIAAWRRQPVARLKLSQLTPQHFIEFKNARLAAGAAGSTVLSDLSLISQLYKVAKQEWGMPYLTNPIADVRKPRPGKGRDRRLTPEEAARFSQALEQCSRETARLVILFALQTAARRGEILRLKWADVDWQRRTVVFRDTKNSEDRAVPLSQDALLVLRMATRSESPCVFPTTVNVINKAWREILKKARISNFRFHDLRHEATTALFERQLTTMEVQRITGHKTLAMLVRYTQMDVSHLVMRLDETDSRIGPPGAGTSAALRADNGARVNEAVAPLENAAAGRSEGAHRGEENRAQGRIASTNVIAFRRRRTLGT